jgi:WD40 repeat protein/tetratricopeptide (TPR) repeat protein
VAVAGYDVLGMLGKGGMGVVYKARQLGLDRVVALKMIRYAEDAGPDERERFRTEAHAVARLQHPNIVQIYEVGECGGRPYFSLEYCPGGCLADQLDGTPWEPRRAAQFIETLAGAMEAAHRAEIVHRDLKPANVLLTEDGTPKVADFGLARRLNRQGGTRTGAVIGTPSYMAPEQAEGKRGVGPAADVYALGAILYELLTGRPPFKAATDLDTILQVVAEEPVPVRRLQLKVPRDLETVCHKCLEKDPRKRYATAAALAEDLRRFQAGEPVSARPVGTLGRVVKWARRRPAVTALLAAVALVTLFGATGMGWAYREAVRQQNLVGAEADRARNEARRADSKAEEARMQALDAARARDDARWQTYCAEVGRADAQLQAGNHSGAYQVLQRTRLEHRGWEYQYLRNRTDGTLLTLHAHNGPVYSVCYSADGSRIASASQDNTVKVWDARSGAELLTLRGHAGAVRSVSYSPDGTQLASASEDSTVKVWDARTGIELFTLRGHTGKVRTVSYHPNGSQLASAAQDSTIKVWDARSGALLLSLRGHFSTVTSVSYSPDGSRIASGAEDKAVKVWGASSGAELFSLRGHAGWPTSVSYSPDGSRIATASRDTGKPGELKVWDARSGALLLSLPGHTSQVYCVSYSPDGMRLASASNDNTVKVWDAHAGAELLTLRGHTGGVNSVSYSADGSRIASASHDGTVKVWDSRTGAEVLTLRGQTASAASVSYSPDGSRLASAGATLKVWDTCSGAELLTLRGHTGSAASVSYSPDGTRLASAGGEWNKPGEVTVWDARSGAEVLSLRGHTGPAVSVSYSPDGSRIASASPAPFQPGQARDFGELKVWDARSGALLLSLPGHTSQVHCVSYSPDGMRLASCSHQEIKIWDAKNGAEVLTLRTNIPGDSLSYSPDGSRLASTSRDCTITVWDAHTGATLFSLRGHTDSVTCARYSPDGSRIASASDDHTVKLWDARSGAELLTLRGHNRPVGSLSYSPDGGRLASASADGTIKIWDARRGQLLPDPVTPPWPAPTNPSSNGLPVAPPQGEPGRILGRQPPAGAYNPWAQDFQRRAALAPDWHAQDAAAAEQQGDYFAAAFHRRRLAELRPRDWLNQLHLATACLLSGRVQEAVDIFDRLLAADPHLAPAYLERARLRLALGDRPGADADALAALTLASVHRSGWSEIAHVEAQEGERAAQAGEWSLAREHFQRAALWQASQSEHRWQLALVNLAAGGPEAYRRTLLQVYQSDRGTEDLEVPWKLSAMLAASAQVPVTPANMAGLLGAEAALQKEAARRSAKAVDLAKGCWEQKQLYAAAARLYTFAFIADPTLAGSVSTYDRYNAACCAALAAAGRGDDTAALGEAERVQLRQRAHQWLRADLAWWSKTLNDQKDQQAGGRASVIRRIQPDSRASVLQQMQSWQHDSDLASVRDREALAALPDAERRLWEQLWADVTALLDRAQKAK